MAERAVLVAERAVAGRWRRICWWCSIWWQGRPRRRKWWIGRRKWWIGRGREAQNADEARIGDQDVGRGPPVRIAPSRPHLYVFLFLKLGLTSALGGPTCKNCTKLVSPLSCGPTVSNAIRRNRLQTCRRGQTLVCANKLGAKLRTIRD